MKFYASTKMKPHGMLGVIFVLFLGLAGCQREKGPAIAPVKGMVTLNKTPLARATVRFQPVEIDGTYSVGVTDENGRFELQYTRSRKGALVGKHSVSISTGYPDNEDENGNPQPIPEVVPAEYRKNSILIQEVLPQTNEFEFHLISKNKKS